MTHKKDASPVGSTRNEDHLVPSSEDNLGAYTVNPLAGLALEDVTSNVMGPAIGIGSTALGTMFVRKVLAPRLPATVTKFAPLLSGIAGALAAAPLLWWKKDVGISAAGTALILGGTLQLMDYFGVPTTGAYTANRLGAYTAKQVGAYTANQVGALPAGTDDLERLPGNVQQGLNPMAYGGQNHAYGRPYGQYVG
jgi:hypothetical protein